MFPEDCGKPQKLTGGFFFTQNHRKKRKGRLAIYTDQDIDLRKASFSVGECQRESLRYWADPIKCDYGRGQSCPVFTAGCNSEVCIRGSKRRYIRRKERESLLRLSSYLQETISVFGAAWTLVRGYLN